MDKVIEEFWDLIFFFLFFIGINCFLLELLFWLILLFDCLLVGVLLFEVFFIVFLLDSCSDEEDLIVMLGLYEFLVWINGNS